MVFVIRKKLLAQPKFSWLHPMCNSLLPIISYSTCCHDLFLLFILVLGEFLVPCCVHVSMRSLINWIGCFIIRNNVQTLFLSRSGDSSKFDKAVFSDSAYLAGKVDEASPHHPSIQWPCPNYSLSRIVFAEISASILKWGSLSFFLYISKLNSLFCFLSKVTPAWVSLSPKVSVQLPSCPPVTDRSNIFPPLKYSGHPQNTPQILFKFLSNTPHPLNPQRRLSPWVLAYESFNFCYY